MFLVDKDGILRNGGRVFVPRQRALIDELLRVYHDDQFSGHWGVEKTLELIQRKFYWIGITKDVREYIQICPVCQRKAISHHKPYGSLQPLPQPNEVWREIALDFITGLPESRKGLQAYNTILTVVDRKSKMARFIPTRDDLNATQFAELFHEEIELRFGSPRGIVSDRDSHLTSDFWAEVCRYSLIKRRMSMAFHPQTDGQSEVLNRILEDYLCSYTNET